MRWNGSALALIAGESQLSNMARKTQMPKIHRVQVDFTEAGYAQLQLLMRDSGHETLTDTVKAALHLFRKCTPQKETMSRERQRELEESEDAQLTSEEKKNGWYFCIEFDDMLTPGEEVTEEGACAFCGFDKNKVK